jgi:hypothetical protein
MHRLLSKLKPEANEARRGGREPQHRAAPTSAGAQPPRARRSLNEAAHKLYR